MNKAFKKFINNFGIEYFGRFYGVYTAIVFQDLDPEDMGRILIQVPEVYPDNRLVWARPLNMPGGKGYGAQVLPAVSDWVNVQFLNGDPKFPVWSHGGYAKGEKPEEFKSNQTTGYKSLGGFLVHIDDETKTLTIKSPVGNEIKVNDEDVKINIPDKPSLTVNKHGVKYGDDFLTNSKELIEKLKELADLFQSTSGIWQPGQSGPPGMELNSAVVDSKIQDYKRDLDRIESKST